MSVDQAPDAYELRKSGQGPGVEGTLLVLPLRRQPGDGRGRQARAGAQELLERRTEVAARQAMQIQQRQDLRDLRRLARPGGQDRRAEPEPLAAGLTRRTGTQRARSLPDSVKELTTAQALNTPPGGPSIVERRPSGPLSGWRISRPHAFQACRRPSGGIHFRAYVQVMGLGPVVVVLQDAPSSAELAANLAAIR